GGGGGGWRGAAGQDGERVDEMGGLEEAADMARSKAGLPATAPLIHYPRLGPLDRIRPPSNSEDRRAAAATFAAGSLIPLAGLDSTATAAWTALLAESWGP